MHLIKLQPSDKKFNDKMLKACMRIVDYVATDEVANDAVKRITEVLYVCVIYMYLHKYVTNNYNTRM